MKDSEIPRYSCGGYFSSNCIISSPWNVKLRYKREWATLRPPVLSSTPTFRSGWLILRPGPSWLTSAFLLASTLKLLIVLRNWSLLIRFLTPFIQNTRRSFILWEESRISALQGSTLPMLWSWTTRPIPVLYGAFVRYVITPPVLILLFLLSYSFVFYLFSWRDLILWSKDNLSYNIRQHCNVKKYLCGVDISRLRYTITLTLLYYVLDIRTTWISDLQRNISFSEIFRIVWHNMLARSH